MINDRRRLVTMYRYLPHLQVLWEPTLPDVPVSEDAVVAGEADGPPVAGASSPWCTHNILLIFRGTANVTQKLRSVAHLGQRSTGVSSARPRAGRLVMHMGVSPSVAEAASLSSSLEPRLAAPATYCIGSMNSRNRIDPDEVRWLAYATIGLLFVLWINRKVEPSKRPTLRCQNCGGEMKLLRVTRRHCTALIDHSRAYLDSG